jgi:hypothetical protein
MQEPTWEAVPRCLDHLEQEHEKWKQANYWSKLVGLTAVAMLGLVMLLAAAIIPEELCVGLRTCPSATLIPIPLIHRHIRDHVPSQPPEGLRQPSLNRCPFQPIISIR